MRALHKRLLVIIGLSGSLVSCGNSDYPMPRGIGGHPADLKAAPCACMELPLVDDSPEARDRLRAAIRAVAAS